MFKRSKKGDDATAEETTTLEEQYAKDHPHDVASPPEDGAADKTQHMDVPALGGANEQTGKPPPAQQDVHIPTRKERAIDRVREAHRRLEQLDDQCKRSRADYSSAKSINEDLETRLRAAHQDARQAAEELAAMVDDRP